MTTVKKRQQLTLRDRLSRLTFTEACKLIGAEGKKLIQQGATYDIEIAEQVEWQQDQLRVTLSDDVLVIISLRDSNSQALDWQCSECNRACVHVGAAFSLVLEDKVALGLATPPQRRAPVESLDEHELVERALSEREERATKEKMKLTSLDPDQPWSDYMVTSLVSGKTYRLALRGLERGSSYCSCPDFRTNTLGTCKHLMFASKRIKKKFAPQALRRPFKRTQFAVHLRYGDETTLRLETPTKMPEEAARVVGPLLDKPLTDISGLLQRVQKLNRLGMEVIVYPDAEEFIQQRLFEERMRDRAAEIRRDPARHPLRDTLLKVRLLPYQLDGIAFAAGAGRAILADDMGLGKTIQGIGVAELLAREAEIQKVLVICPTSLKAQWKNEIARFSNRDCQLVVGGASQRPTQYGNDCFFTVCNYEQVLRDILAIERTKWDLIILDEGQRIKNWEAKTTNVVKQLKSRFALVLSGTPLENRLDELYSVVQFIDDRRLGPGFRFFNRHRITDEKGKVLGYKKLDELRTHLKPILLRRTRAAVLSELPPRTDEIVRIAPTAEQVELHRANMRVVSSIVRKSFISEMDLLRLRQALLMCRMAANGTYLVDKQRPSYSSKLERLDELFEDLFAERDRKIILFSEWTTMLTEVEQLLRKHKRKFVRLDGSVPQSKRQGLVHEFQNQPECQLFLTTNAGSTGLNLQAANTIINVDLPWNPAVLEQRIARAHRMGQTQPVQVYVLITENTIEENLLQTLADKRDLALAALDADSDVSEVDFQSGVDELKQRLEVLTGAKREAAIDVSMKNQAAAGTESSSEHRERVAAAGGELLGAAFKFLGELITQVPASAAPAQETVAAIRTRLNDCVEEGPAGQQRLTFTIPDRQSLNGLAETLARLLSVGATGGP